MKRTVLCLSTGLLVLALTGGMVFAQGTAQISGTVKDQSGAVLPGVEITATQTDTGIARTTVTNETGSYVLPNLPIGPYRVEAALPGFRTFVQTGIVLQVNSNPVINPTLEVGQVTEQVEVQANATQVETRSAGVGQVIETQRILELPLNGRNVTDLITLSGARRPDRPVSRGFGMRTGVMISVAGGIGNGVEYSLDGATAHQSVRRHQHAASVSGCAAGIQSVDQQRSDASNGMHSGGAVNAVTKSGTNAFHGDLFEFVRNNVFNARDFFAVKNDGLKRNQFGGTIGGPIKKDKMFFFAGYQGTTIRQSPSRHHHVRSDAGDAGRRLHDILLRRPATTAARLRLRAPFVNNRLNPAQFSPAAVKIAARLPKALRCLRQDS